MIFRGRKIKLSEEMGCIQEKNVRIKHESITLELDWHVTNRVINPMKCKARQGGWEPKMM